MGTKKTSTEEPQKIKKPLTAYFIFLNDRRVEFKEKNPDLSMG